MIILLFIITIGIALLAIFEDYLKPNKWAIYFLTGFILIGLATIRPIGIDKDSENYEYFFENFDDPILAIGVEMSYLWISQITHYFSDNFHNLLFIYALIGIASKFYAISKLSHLLFFPLLFYVSNYYIIHEITQIRAGIASGFFMISIYFLASSMRIKAFIFMLLALFFHYSSLVLLPLLFLSNKRMPFYYRLILFCIIPLCYTFYFLHIDLLTSIPIPYIAHKIEAYQKLTEHGLNDYDLINVFNLVFLVKVFIFAYIVYFYDTILEYNKSITLLLKIQFLSICTFIMFSSLPVVSFRVSELYGVTEILLFPNIYYTIKQTFASKIIVCTIGLILFIINIFYNQLLKLS